MKSEQKSCSKLRNTTFFAILCFLLGIGLLGVLGGLKILPGVNLGLFRDFDFQDGVAGALRLFYDPLCKYNLPVFVICFIGSLAMAIRFKENAGARIATYVVAFVPALLPILYLVLWVMLVFAVVP